MATPVAVAVALAVAKRNRAAMETGRKSVKAVKEITKKIGRANFLDLLGNYLGRHWTGKKHQLTSTCQALMPCVFSSRINQDLLTVRYAHNKEMQLIIPIMLLIIGID